MLRVGASFAVALALAAVSAAALVAAPAARAQLAADSVAAPFACDLGAFTATERARHEELGRLLRPRALGIRELANGHAVRFAPESSLRLDAEEFIALERRCCPFLELEVSLDSSGESLWVSITGPSGAKPFIEAEFDIAEGLAAGEEFAGAGDMLAGAAGSARPAPLETLELAALRDAFNRANNIVRVVAILSPT